ncbi:SusC/RagA family TonB-linked outer membrane protein [Sphingobacterium gobiense]|nr:TonB-dependent receptor [Sphingobacterium gobiense]
MVKRFTNPSFFGKSLRLASVITIGVLMPIGVALANESVVHAHAFYQQTVTGSVTSAGGPVAAVTVSVSGSLLVSTQTDENGNFSISAKDGDVLVFTAVGFDPHTAVVEGSILRVVLKESDQALEEVVVTGYSTQKRESLTGSLQVVTGDELRDITTPSVENMLSAKAPGVQVTPGSAQPGQRGAVVIRGQATLSGATEPLWVIDGVIVGSEPGDINPDDIESMTVLKDAASTAIYGSQGANGVIVITTKNPKVGKTTVNYATRMGFNKLNNGNVSMMNGAELYDYYSSFENAGDISFPRWNSELRNSNFDWWDLATKTGFTQNHNLTVQGGTETLQSFLSLGYYDEQGAVKGYDFDRYNVRFRQVYKPLEWLTIKPSIVGARRGVENRQYSVTAMYSRFPWDSPFDENGNLVPHRYNGWVNNSETNYLYDLQWNHSQNTNYEFMGNFDFDIKLTDWLTFSSVNNYRYNTYANAGYEDPRSNAGIGVVGRLTDYRFEYARRYTNQILRVNKTWDKHTVSGLLAYEFNDYSSKTLDVYGIGIIPGFEVMDAVTSPERTRGARNEWAVQSFLSDVHYSYDNKYMAQLSFRRDGASNFGDNAKYGNFFSISGAWNIHYEDWFRADWVNTMKIRAAYGSVGNRPTALYPQYDLYSVEQGSGYNGRPGALISQKGNRDLTWEKTYTAGAGVDATFLNNRLRTTLDFYVKDTDNVLYQVPVTGTVGITSMWRNIGAMRNTGFEIAVGGDIIQNDDWYWSVDLNVGHNKNKLIQLFETRGADGTFAVRPVIVGDGSNIAGSAQRVLEPGRPVDTYYMREWAGVNPDNGAPMWYKTETNTEGNEVRTTTSNYADATLTELGKAAPDLYGGLSTALKYKQFDLGAVFGYSIGGKIYNYSRQEYDSDGAYTDRNQMKLMPGWSRWEKPGDNATHPVAKYGNRDNGNKVSSRYLEDNDFLRLRSLTLGYNFKLEQYNIRNLRVFFTGENLFTLTNYSGVDPEIPLTPLDGRRQGGNLTNSAGPSVYPAVRRFMFGFNVSF